MTATEAIARARTAHRRLGCCCPKEVVGVQPRGNGEFVVSIAHAWWCPYSRSLEGPPPT